MNVLFISRKNHNDVGGLSRFTVELTKRFPQPKHLWFTKDIVSFFKIPFSKIDIIHLSDATLFPLGVLLKSIIHKPIVVTAHGLDLAYPNGAYQTMLRITTPRAHAFILDSPPVKKLFAPFPIRINTIRVINPGISIDHLKKTASIKLPNLLNKTVLVTVGNLVRRKGHLWFITNVLSKLNGNFIYLIVGDGPERSTINKQINKLRMKDRVFLLGKLTNKQLSYALKKSHIYVCPNQKDRGNFEGFGIAAGEAACLGLPVVASRVDGIPYAIHHEKNGILVDPKPSEFLRAIRKLENKTERIKLGRKAKKYTQTYFRWNDTINKYLTVFQEVIDKTPKSR